MKCTTSRIWLLAAVAIFTTLVILPATGCGVAKDTRLQMKIKEELRKDKNIQADKLTINVRDGHVVITGELYTQEEIDRVMQVVQAMEGVVSVDNKMSLPDNYNAINPTFLDPF